MLFFRNANDRLALESSSSFSQFPTGNAIQSRSAFSPFKPVCLNTLRAPTPKPFLQTPSTLFLAFQIAFFPPFFPIFIHTMLGCLAPPLVSAGCAANLWGHGPLSSQQHWEKNNPKDGFAEIKISRIFLLRWTFQPAVTFCCLYLTYPYVTP